MNMQPITSAQYFLLMRLLQQMEKECRLPVDEVGLDEWQMIYSKLNHACLVSRTVPAGWTDLEIKVLWNAFNGLLEILPHVPLEDKLKYLINRSPPQTSVG